MYCAAVKSNVSSQMPVHCGGEATFIMHSCY